VAQNHLFDGEYQLTKIWSMNILLTFILSYENVTSKCSLNINQDEHSILLNIMGILLLNERSETCSKI